VATHCRLTCIAALPPATRPKHARGEGSVECKVEPQRVDKAETTKTAHAEVEESESRRRKRKQWLLNTTTKPAKRKKHARC